MDKKTAKKRLKAVKREMRKAAGIELIKLELELEMLMYLLERM